MLSPMDSDITCGECGGPLGRHTACAACRAWAKRGDAPNRPQPPGVVEGLAFLKDMATGAYQPPKWVWAVLIIAFLYLINPLDLIPDVAFPVGFVDDLLVLAATFTAVREAHARYLAKGKM